MTHDYLIVGSGLFGSIFARQMTDAGAKCLVVDRRSHIGGNCYTRDSGGILVHEYGPHIFHTSSDQVWNYMNRWTRFNHFTYRPKVMHRGILYSFPINLFTLYHLWGTKTPDEAQKKLDEVRVRIENPANLEEWVLSQLGEEIYHKFIYGYTRKQWGKNPTDLPSYIIKRLPIRLTFDDNYYEDSYQGIPEEGYTAMFKRLLEGIPREMGVDYFKERDYLEAKTRRTVYTGAIDEFFDCDLGHLEWRSLRFAHESRNISDFQGVAVINYTEEEIPYTRICEHKHFNFGKQGHTVITREYPQKWDASREKFYPVNDETNNDLYARYRDRIDTSRYLFGGRLADYRHYDMDQVVRLALKRAEGETSK